MNDYLKIMIVDDEDNERNLLKVCIDWSEFGMEIAMEASGAAEALDYLEDFSPDIIITDICMPFMDGIEFSRIVVDSNPSIRIIVLTAHDDFNYAKESIKIGIADYLLKPIKTEELKNALLNQKNNIEAERLHKKEYDKFKKQLRDAFPFLKEKFLNELIQESSSGESRINRIKYFEIACFIDNIQIALIETTNLEKEFTQEQGYLLSIKSTEIVKDYFKENKKIEVFTDNTQKTVVLSGDPDINLVECCEKIKLILLSRLSCCISIGVGKRYESINHIRKSYIEASDALNYKMLYGNNQVVSYSDTNINPNSSAISIDCISEICFAVKTGMSDKVIEMIDSIFKEFYIKGLKSMDHVRVISINIVTTILNSITELGLQYQDVLEDVGTPINNILKIDNIPEMIIYLKEIIMRIIKSINSIYKNNTNNIINNITNYLSDNLSNPQLSLSSVANVFHMNSSYLSRIFRQKTSHSFIEYLTRLRIEKASSLFRETDLKLYEVAEKVGIQDPKYFSKCFKKYMGLSVNEYKKLNP
ncbi:MAG: response regulator [Bacillota bacterium]|nr:response regulator [Bacillota bacterium]